MLKWAVNAPRLSYLEPADSKVNTVDLQFKAVDAVSTDRLSEPQETPSNEKRTPSALRQRLKRKSSDFYLSRRLQSWLEKENQVEDQNQITSTPLHSTTKVHESSCQLRRLNSLKDLSNIIPYETVSPNTSPKPISFQLNTPNRSLVSSRKAHNNPSNYATTLPTLEVEYSPCGPVPGPILALRGLGIADTYFDKPRYLPTEEHSYNHTLIRSQNAVSTENSTFQSQRNTRRSFNGVRDDTASLSSSRMGDQTLERMIDAILESTRKEKKPIKFAKQFHHHQRAVMSPTYRPAEDPANDLSEFWSEEPNQAPIRKRRRSLPVKMATPQLFNEREVRSPIAGGHRSKRQQNSSLFHLRRQRAVRRKRKTSKSGGKSTKKNRHKNNEVAEALVSPELAEPNSKTIENASPDSGHNSCSELDENTTILENECLPIVEAQEHTDLRALDATKRRLSFSNRILTTSQ
ncbi:PREDICTED: uncharacterized protein LOC108365812 [Rhagoletis zephyria]|uniref:uncharacterized protein LOC108365812 n=1 Tax=Rhagoletis zephyria TaxID=28612 RepID=UPI00081129DE|nr:PREDICTED: uncharacterized protein LOC108365812 [Rhagoletis zephyria]XP_017475479.1 PREDICTED: uncharacterized protein LOC108365812 [Rhagoletis zephyria]XP_017475480.1 PREDICTED: uncharacterized protein LOC108365812 [Rhagoletis zephyria]